MNLINPFEQAVVFGKAVAYDESYGSAPVVLRALVPTGRHVGHANDLKRASGPRSGGPATKLERYRGSHAGGVGKAANSTVGRAIVRGRGMNPRTSSKVQGAWAADRGNGTKKRALSVESLRSKVNFGDAGSTGRRL